MQFIHAKVASSRDAISGIALNARGPLDNNNCKKYSVVVSRPHVMMILSSMIMVWLISVFGWYSWAYSTDQVSFHEAKSMGIIFIFPLMYSVVVLLFFYYDNEIASSPKIKISSFCSKTKKMLISCFVLSIVYSIFILMVILAGYKKEIVPFHDSNSVFMTCWSSMWNDLLEVDNLKTPPHDINFRTFLNTHLCL